MSPTTKRSRSPGPRTRLSAGSPRAVVSSVACTSVMASTSRDGAAERAGPACVTGRPEVGALPAAGPEGRIVLTVAEATGIVMHIVLAANPQADQPWVADAAAALVKQTGATIAVVSVDEVELERFAPAPR